MPEPKFQYTYDLQYVDFKIIAKEQILHFVFVEELLDRDSSNLKKLTSVKEILKRAVKTFISVKNYTFP